MITIRYTIAALLGPAPTTELPGNRNILWTPGREVEMDDDDARRLLKSGGRAFEKVDPAAAVRAARPAKKTNRPSRRETPKAPSTDKTPEEVEQ